MSTPILLSTDIGSDIDDALALLAILHHPTMDLRGIYTVNGKVAERAMIAKRLVECAARPLEIACGSSAARSHMAPYSVMEEALIDDAYLDYERMQTEDLSDLYYQPLSRLGIHTDAVERMAVALEREPHIVFSLAPMTDIATLLEHHPQAAKQIERLYIMGFRLNGELEHNVRFDTKAAHLVMQSDVPITIIPGDLCRRYRMPLKRADNLQSPEGRYVSSMLDAFVGAQVVERSGREQGLLELVANARMAVDAIELRQRLKIEDRQRVFLANFDIYSAYYERDYFLADFQQLIADLANPQYRYPLGNALASTLASCIMSDVSVADVYVPFCHLQPETLKTAACNLDCDLAGRTIIYPGTRHTVVTDLDTSAFEQFLTASLY